MVSTAKPVDVTIVSAGDPRLSAHATQLHLHASLGLSASIINSLILVAVLRNHIEWSVLALWWASLAAVSVGRYAQAWWFHNYVSQASFDGERWTRWFVAGIGASGIVWGLSGVVLFPSSIPHQTFIAFVLEGMVAGAAATFSVRMDAFLAYTIPALTPLVVQLLRQGDELHVAMGIMVSLFGLLLTGTAYRVHALLRESLREVLSEEKGSTVCRRAEEATLRDPTTAETPWDDEAPALGRTDDESEAVKATVQRYRRQKLDSLQLFATTIVNELGDTVLSTSKAPGSPGLDTLMTGAHGGQVVADAPDRTLRAAELISQLQKYSGERRLGTEPVDLNALIADLQPVLQHLSRNLTLEYRLGERLPLLDATPTDLRELVINLVENPVASLDGSLGSIAIVTRTEALEPGSICDALTDVPLPAGRYVSLEVADSGSGMDKETCERAFDPFFTTHQGSRGLGLAVVLGVVRSHGGFITLHTRTGSGTSIKILFPVAD